MTEKIMRVIVLLCDHIRDASMHKVQRERGIVFVLLPGPGVIRIVLA